MMRHAAAIAVALCLSPSLLSAQSVEFTVNTASANVHKAPSTGSPVIGKAPRGAVLAVSRELGSWVKVSWTEAQEGAGYVHVSMGSVARNSSPRPSPAVALASTRPTPDPALPATPAPESRPSIRPVYVNTPRHVVGVGARIGGSTLGIGGTARAWRNERLGVQLEVSRYALTGVGASSRLTSIQFVPSVLYPFKSHVTDYLLVRPYVGAGANVHRHTMSTGTLVPGSSVTDSGLGVQTFGGGEMTFASIPRFTLSADAGYHWARTPASLAGFDIGGVSVAVSGHWYVK